MFLFAVFCNLFVCDTCTSAFKVEMAVLCFSTVLFGEKNKLLGHSVCCVVAKFVCANRSVTMQGGLLCAIFSVGR